MSKIGEISKNFFFSQNLSLGAGGKPSTRFPPGTIVELSFFVFKYKIRKKKKKNKKNKKNSKKMKKMKKN